MADDIRTLKMFMEGFTLYGGTEIGLLDDPSSIITINTNATAIYTGPFVLASTPLGTSAVNANTNNWIFDQLILTQGANTDLAGGGQFRCYNQQRIDLTGLLQLGTALAPLGSASQRAGVPQLCGDWFIRDSAARSLTYMRDFTIWSTEPLTQDDINSLYSDGIVRQSITPNMPNFYNSTGSMTTTQMLSSQSRLFVHDGSLSSLVGWMKEIFNQQGGMGETAATPHVYVTRVIAGQFTTAPQTIDGVVGISFSADKFFISVPPSWEILNVGMIEPDDLEYLTYMQRSVLAPAGRTQ